MEKRNLKAYVLISGVLFGLLVLLHLLRVVNGWALAIGQFSVPMWASYVGIVVSAALCVWAIRLTTK